MDRSGPVIVTQSDDQPSRYVGAVSGSAVPQALPSDFRTPVATVPSLSSNHVVQTGDTLYSIAFQYDIDYRSLAIVNALTPPYTIFVGQNLNLNVNQPVARQSATPGPGASLGQVVSNTSVARAQAASTSSASVLRQPITRTSTVSTDPQWQWPVQGQILQGFESRAGLNKGIDIEARVGDPVRAAAAGDVVYSGSGIQGSGNLVIIRHSDRYLSAYAHNRQVHVSQGDSIRAGDEIAEVGINEQEQAALHFEIRRDGKPVDPLTFLPR